jgi:hypothetical protein
VQISILDRLATQFPAPEDISHLLIVHGTTLQSITARIACTDVSQNGRDGGVGEAMLSGKSTFLGVQSASSGHSKLYLPRSALTISGPMISSPQVHKKFLQPSNVPWPQHHRRVNEAVGAQK